MTSHKANRPTLCRPLTLFSSRRITRSCKTNLTKAGRPSKTSSQRSLLDPKPRTVSAHLSATVPNCISSARGIRRSATIPPCSSTTRTRERLRSARPKWMASASSCHDSIRKQKSTNRRENLTSSRLSKKNAKGLSVQLLSQSRAIATIKPLP